MDFVIRYNKTFLKELAKIPAKQRAKIECFVFEEILQFKSTDQIPPAGADLQSVSLLEHKKIQQLEAGRKEFRMSINE